MASQISIVAALIDDGRGRVFLVRKRGTSAFMLAGGKANAGETPLETLTRELKEELGFVPNAREAYLIGKFSAQAANEPGCRVNATIFHLRACGDAFAVGAELEEGLWIGIDEAGKLPLAPLARDHVLPLARGLC